MRSWTEPTKQAGNNSVPSSLNYYIIIKTENFILIMFNKRYFSVTFKVKKISKRDQPHHFDRSDVRKYKLYLFLGFTIG